ncbi:reverse transcriptase domain-containing protein [Tanacetum coccineum]
MSSDFAVTYTSVHSKARSWSIPFEDPYEEAARQLLDQAPCSPEFVPDPMELEDHVPVYIPEPEYPEHLVLVEDEAPIEAYITDVASAPIPPLPLPSFLPSLIRPPHIRTTMAQRRATTPSIYHSLLPAGTPPLLPIPLPAPSTSRRADILEADMLPRKRLLLTAPTPRVEVGESSVVAAAARQPGSTMASRVDHSFLDTVDTRVRDTKRRTMASVEVVNLRVTHQADVRKRESLGFYSRHQEAQEDRAAVRAEIEILKRERLAYEQESIETRQALAWSEAYSRALEAWIRVLETQAYCHEWQRQDADDRTIEHIILANAIEAIAIYESINQTKQQENKVVGNASNKRKWEGDHNRGSNQQQNKEYKVFRAHAVGTNNKKEYVGTLPLCNKCKFNHVGLCAERCSNYKWRGHQARDCRISSPKAKPRPSMAKLKVEVTCYECGELGHYKRDCPIVKLQNHVDKFCLGKGVVRFGKQRKLNPKDAGPFKVLAKKCLSDEPLAILLDELHIDDKLHFVEEPVEIMDREVNKLKQSRILIIKVRWNFRRGPEFTWEREDEFQKKYLHLFTKKRKTAPSTSATS